MTQTPPKPPSQRDNQGSIQEAQPKSQPFSLFQRLRQGWENLNFRTKLAILLVGGAALPTVIVTQGIVRITQNDLLRSINANLKQELTVLDEAVQNVVENNRFVAASMSSGVATVGIDLNIPSEVSAHHTLLKAFSQDPTDDLIGQSFHILTDAQGRTVAQTIEILDGNLSGYPSLPSKDNFTPKDIKPNYRPVSLPTGIVLGDIPIVKKALSTGRSLSGVEVIKAEALQRLGLEKQANIGIRKQKIEGLPEPKQPFPEGTYNVDRGRAGLVVMAVEPVRVRGKLVGTAIVGTLLNRNYLLPDYVKLKTGVPTATIFAQDWRVTTNVPYADGKTRAVGTRVSREVAAKVLNQGEIFLGEANIVGTDYFTGYSPLYDHQKLLNPSQAKPTGIAYVGEPKTAVQQTLRNLELAGYGLGGGILLLAGLLAVPVAGSFSNPLRRLAGFAQQVADGETGMRLEATERQDEIGILTRDLNEMAVSIEANQEALRQEVVREQLLKEVTAQLGQFPQVKNAFDLALEKLRLTLKADRVILYRFNEETYQGSVDAESVTEGLPRALGAPIDDHYFRDQYVEKYRQGRIQATPDIYEAGLSDCHIKLLEPFSVRANLILPILRGSRGSLAGLLGVHQCSAPRSWQENEINLLAQVAAQIGLALDRANLLEQAQASAERAQFLKDITLKMSQAVNGKAIFDTVVEEIRQTLQADRAIVYQFDQHWKGTVIAESVANSFPKALGAEIADPCFADKYVEKYQQGRVQATPDIYQAGLTKCHLKQLEPFEVKANLVAPILVGGQLLGLLIAHQCSRTRNWEKVEIDFFAQLATQVGLALDRAELLEAQRISEAEQRNAKEHLQKRALELLMEVDPVSRGDLTVRANVTADEIGTVADSYNATIESLRKIVGQVTAAAKQVVVTSSNNGASVEALSTEAMRQTEEILAALDRIQIMTDSLRSMFANAEQALSTVQAANQTVVTGEAAMNRTVEKMMSVRDTVAETAKKVKHLDESSQKISKVVSLISRFAAQTHLLALKASIEAARAGEEGRGFAVIADEVRTLAAQSAEATAEIETLVASIQLETKEVAATMEMETEQVIVGSKLLDETRKNLNEITAASTQINELVKAIAQAALEQSQSSQAVTQTMTDVAAIAQNTSSSAIHVSASFKELLSVAQELQAGISQFKVQ